MHSERLIIRASGFVFLVISLLALSGILLACTAIKNIAHSGFELNALLRFLLGGWLSTYAVFYINGNRIELSDSELSASTPKTGSSLLPQFNVVCARIEDIQSVVLGTMGYFDRNATQYSDANLRETIDFWHGIFVSRSGSLAMHFPMWIAAKHTPILFVQSKYQNRSFVVSTKPFSRASFRDLVEGLKARNVVVRIEENILS